MLGAYRHRAVYFPRVRRIQTALVTYITSNDAQGCEWIGPFSDVACTSDRWTSSIPCCPFHALQGLWWRHASEVPDVCPDDSYSGFGPWPLQCFRVPCNQLACWTCSPANCRCLTFPASSFRSADSASSSSGNPFSPGAARISGCECFLSCAACLAW